MGFIEDAAVSSLELTQDRIRQDRDYGQMEIRPQVDPKQHAEFLAQQRGGRTDQVYRQCLEYHGFRWVPAPFLAPYENFSAHMEGEWRHDRMQLAFTPTDLASSFPGGAQDLDRYVRQEKMKRQVTRGKMPKQEYRRRLGRK